MAEHGDDVDWAGLFHAEGAASDTPRRLRALLGDDAEAFVDGYEHLWSGTLRREGGVWPVTAPAALLVAEWLGDSSLWPDDPTMPEAVLAYLYAVAVGADLGDREAEVRARVTRCEPELRRWNADYLTADATGRELLWGDCSGLGELVLQQAALACGEVVPELLGRVLPHLEADRVRRRTCAAAAVGVLARHPSAAAQRPSLLRRLVSLAGAADSPFDLATTVVAVGQLGGDTRSWLEHPHLGVRVCAALAPALAHDSAAEGVLRAAGRSLNEVGKSLGESFGDMAPPLQFQFLPYRDLLVDT
ncbi:hypothetical protein [Streptomyces sp. NPDC056600]|uniref:hypothetical protein n=1 Tax=Streptomyces sp. NPDC056600 TaxID=3345874 RepID=UPI0036AA6E6C